MDLVYYGFAAVLFAFALMAGVASVGIGLAIYSDWEDHRRS